MTPAEILENENIYFGQDTINGITCSIGYIKKFKWSWFATQLNTFVIIGKTNDKIDKRVIEAFSKRCFEYSLKNHKGWPRGLQSGVGSIAILQGSNIDNEAMEFCRKFSKKHWSAFEIPVLYSIDEKKTIRFSSAPIWGTIFFPFFTKTIDTITNQVGLRKTAAGNSAFVINNRPGQMNNSIKPASNLSTDPFYHGTKANMQQGDLIEPGFNSNYGQRKKAKYVYFTATLDAAIWGAELAAGEGDGRIYIIAPTGAMEDDPNLTDKKFPGNPTRSYRSLCPLRIIGEVTDWQGHSPEQLKTMKDNLERLKQLGIEAIED